MESIVTLLKGWSDSASVACERVSSDNPARITLRFRIDGDSEVAYTGWWEAGQQAAPLGLFLYAPVTVGRGNRRRVCEFLLRWLWTRQLPGRVEFDPDNGVLRYYQSVDSTVATVGTLKAVVEAGVEVLDALCPQVQAIDHFNLAGNEDDPLDAVEMARIHALDIDSDDARLSRLLQAPEAEALRRWVDALKVAFSAGEDPDWKMLGRGVVAVGPDGEHAAGMLRVAAKSAGLKFIDLSADAVEKMPSLHAFSRFAPVLVYLEPGNWSDKDVTGDALEAQRRFHDRLSEWIGDLDSDKRVVVATTVKSVRDLPTGLKRVGMFDRFVSMPEMSKAGRGEEFLEAVGLHRCSDELRQAVAKVGSLIVNEFDGDRRHENLVALRLQRLADATRRSLEFLDIVRMVLYGITESSPSAQSDEALTRTAVHEAGHALMAVLDSHGKNIPEYVTTTSCQYFKGAVMESVAFNSAKDGEIVYADFRHTIRICLAGRAAEEVVFGPDRVGNGSSEDLEKASRYAGRAFAYWGFAPVMTDDGAPENLAVIFDTPTPSEH